MRSRTGSVAKTAHMIKRGGAFTNTHLQVRHSHTLISVGRGGGYRD